MLAGVLLGLAVTARTYPILLILVLGLLAARAGRVRQWLALAGTAVATIAVIVFPWLAANAVRRALDVRRVAIGARGLRLAVADPRHLGSDAGSATTCPASWPRRCRRAR